ncbi:YceD family protein [Vallitalea sp.]|jgi:uncharacterized protein|uniref:YceD family protein n=1 Tax=Vallitalea sp. TaxID=1882829 RepID=UPI0025D13475|nr:DUF177 domain-containing protein [Vallitalea sp.]MCT4687387.1 DUF177 domain-containing protein [Vallitalea sp.]
MEFNLTDLLSNDGMNKKISTDVSIKQFNFGGITYRIDDIIHIDLELTNLGHRKVNLEGLVKGTLKIPCDRCMEEVDYKIETNFSKDINFDDVNEEKVQYIDGYNLDLEKLALNELIIDLPMKVLCSDICKGICNQCGANLNKVTCSCDNSDIDPRLAVFKDLFKEF